MIVSQAPYRVSFFGGGTDYPEWFQEHGGFFLSTAIDHHISIVLRRKPALDKFRYRVVWRELEDAESVDVIKHPFVREALRRRDVPTGLDIVYFGDLPHGAGLGSSSTFGVAFLSALNALTEREMTRYDLAQEVYQIEREMLDETVGIQDQFASAFGGFNFGRISKNGSVSLERISLPGDRLKALSDRLVFVFTGVSRHASNVAASKVKNFGDKEKALRRMGEMAIEARDILKSGASLDDFGELMHESWMLKRGLSDKVAPPIVDEIYDLAREKGVLGGKLLGAGGGGFMVLYTREGEKERISKHLDHLVQVPVKLDAGGPKILVNLPQSYSSHYDRIWQKTNTNGIKSRKDC